MKKGSESKSWRGQVETQVEPPRFRWQTATGNREDSPIKSSVKALNRLVFILLVSAIGMLTFFVYLLLYVPIKTPLITVAATQYSWPFAPNAWSYEDVQAFSQLDGKTIQWNDSGNEWKTKKNALEDLKSRLRAVQVGARKSGLLVLYISAHGAVNDENLPCIIPTEANPLTPSQWISIEELAATIASHTPNGVNVLVALDCVHQRVNWQAAQIDNSFVARLEDWVDKKRPQNLYLLTSASQGEQAWSGPELRSSIFGKLFRLGLAGAADQRANQQGASSANGDGIVSLQELYEYVRSGVSNWVQDHRGTSQSPKIFPSQPSDISLGLSLKNWELGKQIAESQASDAAPGSLSIDELGGLWRSLEQLRQLGMYRYDPKNWAEIEHKLLWLDQLSAAGGAYAELATKQVYPELTKQLEQIGTRAADLASSEDFIAKANVLHLNLDPALLNSRLPSVALEELAGQVKRNVGRELRSQLLDLLEPDSQITAQPTTAASPIAPTNPILSDNSFDASRNYWNEFNFVKLLTKYDATLLWPDRGVLLGAVSLRNQCEQLAVHGDIRGHRWKRFELNAIDRHRRKMEDHLFLGPDDQFAPSLSSLKASIDSMTQVSQGTRDRIEHAWTVRDRGLAELCYLAAWVCSPENNMENLGEWSGLIASQSPAPLSPAPDLSDSIRNDPFLRERLAVQVLVRAIRGLHELGELLYTTANVDNENWDELGEAVSRVEHDLDSLQRLVNDQVSRALSAEPASQSTPTAVTALLGLPFLAVESRNDLQLKLEKYYREAMERDSKKKSVSRLKRIDLLGSSQNAEPPIPAALADQAGENHSTEERFADRMRNWEEHPLSTILRLQESSLNATSGAVSASQADDSDREETVIESVNAALRRYYLSVQAFQSYRVVEWIRSNRLQLMSADEGDVWVVGGLAEHMERAFTPVCPVRSESNAAADFRNLAFQDLLLWYANRSMDDFYADAEQSLATFNAAEEFFERSVRQVLEYSALLAKPTNEQKQAMQTIQDRMTILGAVARNGIRTTVKQGPPIAGSNRRLFELTLQPTIPELSSGKDRNMQLPLGAAVAMVRNSQGIIPDVRIPVPMPVTPELPPLSLSCPALDRSLSHDMVVVYRGHEFKSPMFVGQGILVDFQPMKYDTADVVLFGDLQRQPSLVFVLDCSWSMGEPLPVESLDTGTTSKLELAKQQVGRMLTQIASRPDARAGLRLFGHRLGWSRPANDKSGLPIGKTQILPQPDYPGTIPQDVVPSTDVEAILPLGRFTPEMVGGLNAKLSNIVPWGQSPLYYAIIQSFQDFAADDATTAKSIVVITDGDNFQFNTSGRPGGETGVSTTLQDVERAWQSTKVPLFILGVGISEGSNPDTRDVLQGLAERTNGKYYDVESGNDLLRALSEQFSLGVYQVASEGNAGVKASTHPLESKLNMPIKIEGIHERSPNYTVSFQNTTRSVQLQGGESLEMFLRGDGQDIVSRPYDRLSPRSGILVRARDSARLIARVHRPSQFQDDMVFPISIQDPDNHFTPRPSELWIDISPMLGEVDQTPRTYTFYDVNYEPKTPVPVVSWNASDWPASATQADVRIWAKYESTPALQSILLSNVRNDPQRFAEGIDTVGVEGVTLRVHILENRPASDLLEIQVTEIHGERSAGVGSLRVLLEGNDIGLPVRITRRFEASNRMAIHTFAFEPALGKALLRSPQASLSITSRAAVLDGAWQLEGGQSIRVDVMKASDLLPLESANGSR